MCGFESLSRHQLYSHEKAQTLSEWSGLFAVMYTDWPRTFPELCFFGVKLYPIGKAPRAGYFKGMGIGGIGSFDSIHKGVN